MSRGSLLSATEFCNYTSGGSRADIELLYSTSWEFIRSLEAGNGIKTLNAVVEDVRAGKAFGDSLRDRFGVHVASCTPRGLRACSLSFAADDSGCCALKVLGSPLVNHRVR